MATVWGVLRGETQTSTTCVITEESHKRGPRASAGPPPTPSQHPLGLQELCGGLSRLFWKCFWICIPGPLSEPACQDPDGSVCVSQTVAGPGDFLVLLPPPARVSEGAGADLGSLAGAPAQAAASEVPLMWQCWPLSPPPRMHLVAGVPTWSAGKGGAGALGCQFFCLRHRRPTRLDSHLYSAHIFSAPAWRPCPRPRSFLRAQSGLWPGSLDDDSPYQLFLLNGC